MTFQSYREKYHITEGNMKIKITTVSGEIYYKTYYKI